MQPLALALAYMEVFFSGENIETLHDLFAEDFSFQGPFYEFDTAEGYIAALQADPPEGMDYTILRSFEGAASACLIYQFSKPGLAVPMAQLFEVANGKISRILLIFDTAAFL